MDFDLDKTRSPLHTTLPLIGVEGGSGSVNPSPDTPPDNPNPNPDDPDPKTRSPLHTIRKRQ